MKTVLCLFIACLYLAYPLTAHADDPLPSVSRFPLERLDEMRRALDAARGDTEAVEAWLAKGINPDAQGEIELAYSIGKEDLPVVYRTLAERAVPEWVNGIWFDQGGGRLVLAYKGISLDRILFALARVDLYAPGFTREISGDRHIIQFTSDLTLEIGEDVLTLTSPYGSFEFQKSAEEKPSRGWIADFIFLRLPEPVYGTEPLINWTAKGIPVKVAVHEGEQLFIIAMAADPKSGPIYLILWGVPYFSPLYCAAAYGRADVIRSLISRGASLAPQIPKRKTALHVAAERSRIMAIDALLDEGSDIDARTDEGTTPLMAAVEGPGAGQDLSEPTSDKAREETALHLISRGADLSIKRGNKETVLFAACRRPMPALQDRLLEEGVDAEIRNDDGETPVFAAIRANQPRALDALIRYGASWRLQNPKGETPKVVAKKLRFRDCLGVMEYEESFHWSLGAQINLSKAEDEGYGMAPGLGAFADLHGRLSRSLMLTAELEYAIRGTEADPGDPWLVSAEGSPYYEYGHIGAACMLDFALVRKWGWRLSGVAGAGYRFQISASILTDSGYWEPVEISDLLNSSGPYATAGIGMNGFMASGVYTGVELRYSKSLGGEWTSRGGGLDSLSLLIRIGS